MTPASQQSHRHPPLRLVRILIAAALLLVLAAACDFGGNPDQSGGDTADPGSTPSTTATDTPADGLDSPTPTPEPSTSDPTPTDNPSIESLPTQLPSLPVPTESSPSETPPPSRCVVQDRLTPSCGALWGFYSPGNSLAQDAAMERSVGRQFDIEKRYHDFSNSASGQLLTSDEVDSANQGHILHLSWSPVLWGSGSGAVASPDMQDKQGHRAFSWSAVASGELDSYIDAQARRVAAFGQPLFIDFGHEADINPQFGSPQEFVAAYRHLVERFRANGADNAVWAWVMSGWRTSTSAVALYRSLYPGDDVVDWVGWDPYNHNSSNWRDPLTTFRGFYDLLDRTGIGAGKPRMLGEYGVSADGRRPQWLRDVPAALQQLPNLKAVEYFNSGSWAHFDPDSPDSEAFAEAGHDPWVNPQH